MEKKKESKEEGIFKTAILGSYVVAVTNLVERFFGKITDERIRRGVFRSVVELIGAIHDYIEAHNRNPKPFIWTKDPDAILAKLKPIAKQPNKKLN